VGQRDRRARRAAAAGPLRRVRRDGPGRRGPAQRRALLPVHGDEAERRGDAEALEELARIRPPYPNQEQLGVQRRILMRYRGSLYATGRAREALPALLFAREYTLATRLSFFDCFDRSLQQLWGGLDAFDARVQIPRLGVPVYLFTGRRDWNTPGELAAEWAAKLEAPHVEVVWFDEVGHFPALEAPEAFQRALIEKLDP
jgi:pimeloyl-ACP methyl ester carboxylesterase